MEALCIIIYCLQTLQVQILCQTIDLFPISSGGQAPLLQEGPSTKILTHFPHTFPTHISLLNLFITIWIRSKSG